MDRSTISANLMSAYNTKGKIKMKTIEWKGIKIPDKDCFKKGKKCTPDCPSYDLGWLYPEDEDIGSSE